MNSIKFLIAWIALSHQFLQIAIAQTTTTPAKILIGEKVPDILLSGFLDPPDKTVTLTDLQADLIILDFWNTSCSSCVMSFPKLDSLQEYFSSKIKIIMITSNTRSDIESLFSRIKIRKPNIPIIISDSILFQYFPHTSVPHHVWIDGKSKVVKFITEGYNTNLRNVRSFLSGRDMDLHYKNEVVDFDERKPFLTNDQGGLLKDIQLSSSILNRVDEYGGNTFFLNYDSLNDIVGLKIINASLLQLYKVAYGESIYRNGLFEDERRILLKVKDKSKFIYPGDAEYLDQWMNENIYGYESLVPLSRKAQLYSILRSDLQRTFPYKASIQKKKMVCYVLKQKKSAQIKTKFPDHSSYSDGYKMINVPFSTIFERVRSFKQHFESPIITTISSHLRSDFDITDLMSEKINKEVILKQLEENGLRLIKEEHIIDVLVISDK